MKPAVSIVTPAYNRARLLPRAWNSLLRQTEQDFQWIVVDDGSTDDTPEVVRGFADPRIDYVWQENGGTCAARNRGDREIRADFVVYLDSDDELFGDSALAEMLAEIKAARPEITHVSFTVVGGDGRRPRESHIESDRLEADYADLACEQKARGEFISICRRETALAFPWPPFNGLEHLRHLAMARQGPVLMINKPARIYHATDDSLIGAASALRRAASMADALAQLIGEHKPIWMARCPCQLGRHSFYRAMYLALSGRAIRAWPCLWRAFLHGDGNIRVKAALLLPCCLFPLWMRKKLFLWYPRHV
ncbi:MAG: glycosyltransferase family 2 protein [Zoogloeaceae bacterium]|jgi:glycosyltransferase involved in cell wall biosynthesis|nr:glycosyltransferase family 2 protein [Zoogloeaceae bacterium]